MNDMDRIARHLNEAADAYQRAGGTTIVHNLREVARRVEETASMVDAAQPLIRAALLGGPDRMRAAWRKEHENLGNAMDRAIYCPYDSDRCHDTDYCHCPNCISHRKEHP